MLERASIGCRMQCKRNAYIYSGLRRRHEVNSLLQVNHAKYSSDRSDAGFCAEALHDPVLTYESFNIPTLSLDGLQ